MNKVYCYHPCNIHSTLLSIVPFLSAEKASSCTFGILTNKAFKICFKGTKKSHSFLTSFIILMSSNRGVDHFIFLKLSTDQIPKRPRVQASRAAGSRRYTHTLIHNHACKHARTHARTHVRKHARMHARTHAAY